MTLEALTPIAFKESGALKTLKAGDRFNLAEHKAQKLLRLAEGKVRIIGEGNEIDHGMWIQFSSPLFGNVTAQVVSLEVGQVWIGSHSVLKQAEPVRIPVAWVKEVYCH